MTAPDRIRVAQDADGFWTCREAVSGSQEYVRADLYAALEVQNATLLQNMRDIKAAFDAMRNDLNELFPIQSAEADLMDGPEMSVACAAVVTAAREKLSALEATPPAPKVTEWREITEDDQPPRDVPVLMGCWEKGPRDEWVVGFGLYGSTKGGWVHGRMTHWLPSSFLPSAPTLTAAQEAGKL